MMGCASSQSGGLPGNAAAGHGKSLDATNPTAIATSADNELSAKYPPAEAFEISLDDVDNDNDDGSDSLIKKHPPKRLQKLVEQAATAVPPTTIQHLEEKLAKAEVRRQQYIQQRIDNIATLTGKGGAVSGNGDGDGNGDGCKVEDNDQNDSQNDEHNDAGNGNIDGDTSSKDAGVVQPTTTPNVSADERIQIDGDHNADNRTHS